MLYEVITRHKRRVSVEVTPHHLTLSAPECYRRLGSLAQMNPPLRNRHHQQALWRAVQEGVVDVLGSDHAPHTLTEKAQPYPQSPSGMTGVQTLLPIMLDHVHAGRLSLQRLVDLTSAGPARVFGVEGKGRIALGYDADLTLVDLNARRTIADDWIASVITSYSIHYTKLYDDSQLGWLSTRGRQGKRLVGLFLTCDAAAVAVIGPTLSTP